MSWSSLKWYGSARRKRPGWLDVETVLGELGWLDRAVDRRRYVERMEERALEGKEAGDSGALKRGWILGGDEFRDRILEMLEGGGGGSASDRALRRDHGIRRAEALLAKGLEFAGLLESDLARLPKGDWRKRVIGHVLKRKRVFRWHGLGERLRMGSESHTSRKCARLGDLEHSAEAGVLMKRLGNLQARMNMRILSQCDDKKTSKTPFSLQSCGLVRLKCRAPEGMRRTGEP